MFVEHHATCHTHIGGTSYAHIDTRLYVRDYATTTYSKVTYVSRNYATTHSKVTHVVRTTWCGLYLLCSCWMKAWYISNNWDDECYIWAMYCETFIVPTCLEVTSQMANKLNILTYMLLTHGMIYMLLKLCVLQTFFFV